MNAHDIQLAARMASDQSSATKAWLRALEMTASIGRQPARTLPVIIDELARQFGDAPALLSDEERLSFQTLAERAQRYAQWALGQGLAKGEVVCLLMPNRPEYMAVWLGITRIGGVVALLNTNLTGASLAHCIACAAPRHIIVDARLEHAFAAAVPHPASDAKVWSLGGGDCCFPDIERVAGQSSPALEPSPPAERKI